MNYDQVRRRVINKGYKWFDNNLELNIVSFRNPSTGNKCTNQFDDTLTVSFKENGLISFKEYLVTVDAGKSSLINPINSKGCALLVPDQYVNCYSIGLHKGQYEALVQVQEVKVYRDNDKDLHYKFDESTIDKGLFGINIHRSNPKTESSLVDGWSAGCTVFKRLKDFNEFMRFVKKSRTDIGNRFTYTLI